MIEILTDVPLAALPDAPRVSVRLDEQTGTVVVEAAAPLRGADFAFDALDDAVAWAGAGEKNGDGRA